VENYINQFLVASRQYEEAAHRAHWYGALYKVECSQTVWRHPPQGIPVQNWVPNPGDLYTYASHFINVTWRAVSIQKPVLQNQPGNIQLPNFNWLQAMALVPQLPFNVPGVHPGGVLPAGNVVAAEPVFQGPQLGAAQNNQFDGATQVQQG
jgi:hypothetical protein